MSLYVGFCHLCDQMFPMLRRLQLYKQIYERNCGQGRDSGVWWGVHFKSKHTDQSCLSFDCMQVNSPLYVKKRPNSHVVWWHVAFHYLLSNFSTFTCRYLNIGISQNISFVSHGANQIVNNDVTLTKSHLLHGKLWKSDGDLQRMNCLQMNATKSDSQSHHVIINFLLTLIERDFHESTQTVISSHSVNIQYT